MGKTNEIVLMNFTGIYKEQNFYKEEAASWMELEELSGCSCYCDDEAYETLGKLLQDFCPEGIHFLDSGNYHYMSLLWISKIQEPFRLIVFDNHTDMQPPAFGDILSCGGWAAKALEDLPFLEELVLAGPDQEAYEQTEAALREKVRFLSRERLAAMNEAEKPAFFRNIPGDLPVYISVDKDVLSPRDASTAWSQGDMSLDEIENCLKEIFAGQRVLGMDICGECEPGEDGTLNNNGNKRLLNLWKDWRDSCEK